MFDLIDISVDRVESGSPQVFSDWSESNSSEIHFLSKHKDQKTALGTATAEASVDDTNASVSKLVTTVPISVSVNFFLTRGHAIFQGGRTKYSTLIYKSTLDDCRFRHCRVR